MNRTIYATPFNPIIRQCTGISNNSGFESFEHVIAAMGDPIRRTEAFIIYPAGDQRVLFSYVAFYLGERPPSE